MSELLKVPFVAGIAIVVLIGRGLLYRKLVREHGLNAKQARTYILKLTVGGDTKLLDGLTGWQLYFVPAYWSGFIGLMLLTFLNQNSDGWTYIVSYLSFVFIFINYVFLRVASSIYGSEGNIGRLLSDKGLSFGLNFFYRLALNKDNNIRPAWVYQLARCLLGFIVVFFPCVAIYVVFSV